MFPSHTCVVERVPLPRTILPTTLPSDSRLRHLCVVSPMLSLRSSPTPQHDFGVAAVLPAFAASVLTLRGLREDVLRAAEHVRRLSDMHSNRQERWALVPSQVRVSRPGGARLRFLWQGSLSCVRTLGHDSRAVDQDTSAS